MTINLTIEELKHLGLILRTEIIRCREGLIDCDNYKLSESDREFYQDRIKKAEALQSKIL